MLIHPYPDWLASSVPTNEKTRVILPPMRFLLCSRVQEVANFRHLLGLENGNGMAQKPKGRGHFILFDGRSAINKNVHFSHQAL
jgi:hypothetical protein